ncbi:hypothetical protein BH11PSE6_BH11PSE6_08090 [soil metagenome]
MVGEEFRPIDARPHGIGIVLAAQARRVEAVADLDALHCIDAHTGRGQFSIELGVEGRAPAGGHARGLARDDCAERRSCLARTIDQRLPARRGSGIGAEERVRIDLIGIETGRIDRIAADRLDPGADADFRDDQPRHGTGRDTRRRLARRGAPATAIVAETVFRVIGVIGMTRAIGLRHLRIVLRALIDILDHQADRRAGRPALEHARQDTDLIRFLPLRGEARGARAALVEEGLEIGFGDGQPRRAAIDHRADRGPMRFAPGGEPEDAAEGVEAQNPSP